MDLDDVRLLYSQSDNLPIHGFDLERGLYGLVKSAKRKIVLCSCEFNSKSDFMLTQLITEKLKEKCTIEIYGNDLRQLKIFRSSFDSSFLKVYVWKPPAERSLFHIKSVLIDDTFVYLGSANLSINAMKNSSEWGITTNSPDLCRSLQEYLSKLRSCELFEQLEL